MGTIISFAYCSFNTFKFKGFNMFNIPNRVVVGEGGGPTIASLSFTPSIERMNPPEGGKVGAFKAGVLKGDFAQLCAYHERLM